MRNYSTDGFVKISAVSSVELWGGGNAVLWLFSFGGRALKKISMAAAYRLQISKAIGNKIDLGVKRYRILKVPSQQFRSA
jgi:hypothetical protein